MSDDPNRLTLTGPDAETVVKAITSDLAKAGVSFKIYDLGKIALDTGVGRPGECDCLVCTIKRSVRRNLAARN